jgi:peptidoglycan DL-endopeptidase CwlO
VKGKVRVTARSKEAGRPGTRLRRYIRNALLAGSALAMAVSIFSAGATIPAAADPPQTVAEAKAQVDQLEIDAAAIDQQYDGVREQLNSGRAQLRTTQTAVTVQTAKVARLRVQVGQVALAQFQNRTLDTTAQLFFTSDTDGFLNQISTVEKVSENQNTVLQDFQAEQANLADLENSAKTDVATLEAQQQQLSQLRQASDAKVTEAKAVLTRLTAAERKRIADQERAAALAAQRAALAAQQVVTPQTKGAGNHSGFEKSSNTSFKGSGKTVQGSSKGAIALAFAERQLGKPYQFGASGPGAYDCSGLTSSAWRAAGISIPRTAQAQSGSGQVVAKSDLRPGDLVFFYSPVSHVALYVGNGIVIHAPRPGKTVTYIKMSYMPYAGARRPG